ncbi:hypothetical protein Avbf_17256 [Armadillidium vulgare]|nr:hypothetical protein Avbf_17256 [Armadillidium vulgare]
MRSLVAVALKHLNKNCLILKNSLLFNLQSFSRTILKQCKCKQLILTKYILTFLVIKLPYVKWESLQLMMTDEEEKRRIRLEKREERGKEQSEG